MKLTERTEKWLLKVAPAHIASTDNPTNFWDVKEFFNVHGKYHVFSGGTPVENTIFSSRKVQYAYRAWHDSIHMKFNLEFDKPSELRVANLQRSIALGGHITKRDAKLLELDLLAHIEYFYASGENHPDFQIELIEDCMNHGIDDVMYLVSKGLAVYHAHNLVRFNINTLNSIKEVQS